MPHKETDKQKDTRCKTSWSVKSWFVQFPKQNVIVR